MKCIGSRSWTKLLLLSALISLSVGRPHSAVSDPIPQSIPGDSSANSVEWNEYYHSAPQNFQQGFTYHISFDYAISAQSDNTSFYGFVDDSDQPDRKFAWDEWRGAIGKMSGSTETDFTPKDDDKYIVVFGIHHQGTVTVSNVKITSSAIVKPPIVLMPTPIRTWTSPGHTTYYFDSVHGNDSADGRSAATAWKTLDKANSGTFAAGDQLLLRSGCSWTGYLGPGGSGIDGSPIVVDRYGSGAKPKIDAKEAWLTTVFLSNDSYITVRNLEIINQGPVPIPKLSGVKVTAYDFGDAHSITLDGLFVHDVTGSNVKDDGGGAGIDCSCGGKIPSRFDGLTIENCHVVRTDRNGITMDGNWARGTWYPSLHVVIQHNLLEDIGGDGIVPIACDGCLVQYNVLHGGRMRCLDYAAGIWPWSCDNTTVQYNEVSGMKGVNDAEGYDSDYNCRNTLIQYNYSHNNDGGFLLICDDGSQKLPYNVGNIGTIVRYNVSVDDNLHVFHIAGPCSNTSIYNNTIYLGPKSSGLLVASDSWGGLQTGMIFQNNVLDSSREAGFTAEGNQTFTFQNNAIYGGFQNLPTDSTAISTNPLLESPGGKTPADYRPMSTSPLLNAGVVIQDNGGKDFAGNPVSATSNPTIGAFQR